MSINTFQPGCFGNFVNLVNILLVIRIRFISSVIQAFIDRDRFGTPQGEYKKKFATSRIDSTCRNTEKNPNRHESKN